MNVASPAFGGMPSSWNFRFWEGQKENIERRYLQIASHIERRKVNDVHQGWKRIVRNGVGPVAWWDWRIKVVATPCDCWGDNLCVRAHFRMKQLTFLWRI